MSAPELTSREVALAIIPHITGALSMLGSLYIAVTVLDSLSFTKTPDGTADSGSSGGTQTVGASSHGLVASLRTKRKKEKNHYMHKAAHLM